MKLLESINSIAIKAGFAIMDIYNKDFAVYQKKDDSPLTEADLLAHNIISQGLNALPQKFPVLSEESADISWQERKQWTTYWLVDPLDGTKEFVKKNGEFTVNIALVHQHQVILGVVYAPVLKTCYFAGKGLGAFKKQDDIQTQLIVNRSRTDAIKIVGSRSHPSPLLQNYLKQFASYEIIAMGSSLKFCLVAEGKADLYPRLGPTCEWDTAAAQCVLECSGGKVVEFESNKSLRYNSKSDYLNPYFIAKN